MGGVDPNNKPWWVVLLIILFWIGLCWCAYKAGVLISVGASIMFATHHCDYPVTEIPLKSLNVQQMTSGGFILGLGGFSTNPKYYVYQQDGIGWILKDYYAKYTPLVESDDGIPAYVSYGIMGNCNNSMPHDYLRVPVGTIKVNFDTTVK